MKRPQSQPPLKQDGSSHQGQHFKNEGKAPEYESDQNEDRSSDFAEPVTCISIQKRKPHKKCEEFSGEQYGQWRNEQKSRAERLEKQLKTRWAVEELIEEQLNRFNAQYNQAMIFSTKLKDIATLLMPKWAPPAELAALSWFGDWRPSTIPCLLHSLINSSSSFSNSLAADSDWFKSVMTQLINELRVEEAVIDEEMAEIQANCIFHLPFGRTNEKKKSGPQALACVYSEFRKVHQVLAKAQNLRLKAMDMAVKKVLSPTGAAEFLVAFSKIQDLVHQDAMKMKLTNGPVSVPTK